MTVRILLSSCVLGAALLVMHAAYAQETAAPAAPPVQDAAQAAVPPVSAEAVVSAEATAGTQAIAPETPEGKPGEPVFSDEKYRSLVFTYWEHIAIKDAKNSRGFKRAPTEEELMRDLKTREDLTAKTKPPPEAREIRLGGIVYRGSKDWTIWLNEKRVSPDALPEEVIDLKVYKNYVEMKWFDEWSNQIFPIRLRAHQRFNLDARMFLPG